MMISQNLIVFLLTANVVFIIYLITNHHEATQGEFIKWNKEMRRRFGLLRQGSSRLDLGTPPLQVHRTFKIPIDCSKVADRKISEEISKANVITRHYREYRDNHKPKTIYSYLEDLKLIPDANYIFDESKCEEFISMRGYNKYQVTGEEKAFPLAFIIRTHEQVEQFERLLRIIYRPQNVYCVHVDAKSHIKFYGAIRSITRCFPNVFIATKSETVYPQSLSPLMADINCMKDLTMPPLESKQSYDQQTQASIEKFWSHENLKNKKLPQNWKYLFNLASTDFPLKTNRELVQILTIYNGTNDVNMIVPFPEKNQDRYKTKWKWNEKTDYLEKTDIPKEPVPHDLTLAKGLSSGTFSKPFVEYILTSRVAKDLLGWLEDTLLPEESFFGTLQYNTQFKPPGNFEKFTRGNIGHMSRFVGWPDFYECDKFGYRRNGICVLTNGDLNFVTNRPNFFASRFQLIDDPVAYSCMEDWYLRRHQRENDLSKNRTKFLVEMTPYCEYLHKISGGKIYEKCESLLFPYY